MRPATLEFRLLSRAELPRIWEIDRREHIDGIYELQQGQLVLRPHDIDIAGWPPGEEALYGPILLDCFEHGGWFQGAFDGDRVAGVVVLESRMIGPSRDQLQLKFLHVSRPYRGSGLGAQLFENARARARDQRASALYITATPSENTIRFYLARGCRPATFLDPELFALEPEDIHLVCDIGES
ncbi:MAG: GNAT family N-acetyltransferase [Dehalococcoidia bacterium]